MIVFLNSIEETSLKNDKIIPMIQIFIEFSSKMALINTNLT